MGWIELVIFVQNSLPSDFFAIIQPYGFGIRLIVG